MKDGAVREGADEGGLKRWIESEREGERIRSRAKKDGRERKTSR